MFPRGQLHNQSVLHLADKRIRASGTDDHGSQNTTSRWWGDHWQDRDALAPGRAYGPPTMGSLPLAAGTGRVRLTLVDYPGVLSPGFDSAATSAIWYRLKLDAHRPRKRIMLCAGQ